MLPTTITSNGKVFTLNPRQYPDLNRSEAIFLARFSMLTKDGAKPCYHTDKEVMDCFNITRQTASRIFNKLLKLGYISVTKDFTASGTSVRIVEVNSVKVKQTIPAMMRQAAQSAKQAETAQDLTPEHEEPKPAVSAQRPAVPAPTAPKSLNPDIAAAMARPIAGDQPLVKPENWEDHRAKLWAMALGTCERGNTLALANRCYLDIYTRVASFKCDAMALLNKLDTKAKGSRAYDECAKNVAMGLFVYHFTTKFLRDHQQCPERDVSFKAMIQHEANEYIVSIRAAAKSGQENLAAKVMADLEFPSEIQNDPRAIELFEDRLIPGMTCGLLFANMVNTFLGEHTSSLDGWLSVDAITEPKPLAHALPGNLRRKRELLTFAPAPGIDPRGLPCYQPFTNLVKFDLGPALDQTKFGRFPCYDLFGNLHDFKFDFSELAHLLSPEYEDRITTHNLEPWEFGYTTCFDSDPCVQKAISDYAIFALVTELIAPITAENVFYNMHEHQDDSLLEMFQDYKVHYSPLLFACDVLYPSDNDYSFDARPIYNYVKNNYCAGPKSEKDFAAFVVANNVVRALGDKEQAAKIIAAIVSRLRNLGRAYWVQNLRLDGPTKFREFYTSNLREMLIPNSEAVFAPRFTYPFMLIRKLFGIRRIPHEERYICGHTLTTELSFDPVAQRDLSVLKSTYVADYPFLAQLGGDYE